MLLKHLMSLDGHLTCTKSLKSIKFANSVPQIRHERIKQQDSAKSVNITVPEFR